MKTISSKALHNILTQYQTDEKTISSKTLLEIVAQYPTLTAEDVLRVLTEVQNVK